MAFPSLEGSANQLSDALRAVRSLAHSVKLSSCSLRDDSAAGVVSARRIAEHLDALTQWNAQLNTLKTTPGLADYAKEQFSDATFDIVQAFVNMQAAIVNTGTWISTNIPKETVTNRWMLLEEIVNGRVVERTLTTVQTAGLRTQLDALLATID